MRRLGSMVPDFGQFVQCANINDNLVWRMGAMELLQRLAVMAVAARNLNPRRC